MPKKHRAPSVLGEADALIAAARALLVPVRQVDTELLDSPDLPAGLRALLMANMAADELLLQAHARIMFWLSKQARASKAGWARRRSVNGEEALAADVWRIKAGNPRMGRRAIADELRASGRWPDVTDDDVRRILESGARRKKKVPAWLTPDEVKRYAGVLASLPQVHRDTARLLENPRALAYESLAAALMGRARPR